jgi:hypothetical protein
VAGGILLSCVVSNNLASSWGHGGGAQNVAAYDCLFVTNHAEGDGGGREFQFPVPVHRPATTRPSKMAAAPATRNCTNA